MAELNVSRKNISQVLKDTLKEGKRKIFVIPEYQRPYSWDIEMCDILWNDVKDFYAEHINDNEEYFLGSLVSCIGDEGIAIIDGQQRLTSLFLILRAFYTKLEISLKETPNDKKLSGLMADIAPCIWDVDPDSKEVNDTTKFHIQSKVAISEENDVLHKILETGEIPKDKRSNYAKNYEFFVSRCDEYALKNPDNWRGLCRCFLDKCIVFPIECKDLDSALIIFSTLNNRGLPLNDSDIFKAELYKRCLSAEAKKDFTDKWKNLESTLKEADLSLNDIFRYYSHYIRAYKNDNSKEIGLRKFYSNNDYKLFDDFPIMDDLQKLATFWEKLLQYDDELCLLYTKQLLHCLQCYPNEYWKYITTVFFFKHSDSKNFKDSAPTFFSNLLSFLFIKFLEKPTVNAIKDAVFAGYIEIFKSGSYEFSYEIIDFENRVKGVSSSKISKPLLLLNAYLFDKEQPLIKQNSQIEHIFPKKWDKTYFTWTEDKVNQYLNIFGNKIVIEKILNIQASNGFYSKKKEEYKKSNIKEVNDLCKFKDWDEDKIKERDSQITARLKAFFEANLLSKKI